MINAPVASSGCKWATDGVYACVGGSGSGKVREQFVAQTAIDDVNTYARNRMKEINTPMGPLPMYAGKYPDGSSAH